MQLSNVSQTALLIVGLALHTLMVVDSHWARRMVAVCVCGNSPNSLAHVTQLIDLRWFDPSTWWAKGCGLRSRFKQNYWGIAHQSDYCSWNAAVVLEMRPKLFPYC